MTTNTTINNHVMIDVDQDYTTTETDEKSTENNKHKIHETNETNEIHKNKKNNIIEETDIDIIDTNNKKENKKNIKHTHFSDSNPDIIELLKFADEHEKTNKDTQDNVSLDLDIIDTLNRLEYDDIEHISDKKQLKNINNMLDKSIQLQKNQLKSKFFNQKIIERIKNSLENEIEDASMWRFTWAKIATAMFCISEVLMIIQTALSFTAASYQILLISYLAGVIGVIAIGLNRFGAYSKNQSSEKTTQLNKLLKTIGIDNSLPDLMDENFDKKNNNDK